MGETVRCGSVGGPNFDAMNCMANAMSEARLFRRSRGSGTSTGTGTLTMGDGFPLRPMAGMGMTCTCRGARASSRARLAHTSTTYPPRSTRAWA